MRTNNVRLFTVAAALWAGWVATGRPAPPEKTAHKDTIAAVLEGAIRGMTVPAVVAQQDAVARASWNRVFATDEPPRHESAHLLLYGTVPGKTLKEVGAALDR